MHMDVHRPSLGLTRHETTKNYGWNVRNPSAPVVYYLVSLPSRHHQLARLEDLVRSVDHSEITVQAEERRDTLSVPEIGSVRLLQEGHAEGMR